MTETHKRLLFLLRTAISEQTEEADVDSLSGTNWTELAAASTAQAVPILVLDGLQRYLSAHPDCKPFAQETAAEKLRHMQWLGQVLAYEQMYAKHERTMAELARFYANHGIRMMVLKGYGLSLDWPVPNHRPVGDLDVYHFGQWQEADALLTKHLGVKVDEGHEHHTIACFKGVPIENHYDFINTKAHRDAPKIEARLKELAEKDGKEVEVQGAKIYLPSANFNAIFLMRHMGQHFAGEHLNLRQVLDWGFFIRAHHAEVDWPSATDFLQEIGLLRFFHQINAICVDYLGFAEQDFPTIERELELEKRILQDILHPEFNEEKPAHGLFPILAFKYRRWWHNRWKHPLVYKEWLLPMFLTLLWSHLRRFDTIKD